MLYWYIETDPPNLYKSKANPPQDRTLQSQAVSRLNKWLYCPNCYNNLVENDINLICEGCSAEFLVENGQVDMRSVESEPREVTFQPPRSIKDYSDERIDVLNNVSPPHPLPDNDLRHLPKRLAGFLPIVDPSDNKMLLDVACGDGIHRELCEERGYEWVGVDLDSEVAPVLTDAVRLPFPDETASAAICMKSLHIIDNPWLAVDEIYRVLESHGVFIGNVGFLEPLHENSSFHISPVALFYLLENAGFEVEFIAPGYHSLESHAQIGLFPKLPTPLAKGLVFPLTFLHRLWYSCGKIITNHTKSGELYRRMKFAGEVHFVAKKP